MVPCFLFPDLCQKPAQKLVNYLQKRAKKRPKTHFFLSTVELVEVVFQKTVEVVRNNARPLTSNRCNCPLSGTVLHSKRQPAPAKKYVRAKYDMELRAEN
jgi:hypothetical protein